MQLPPGIFSNRNVFEVISRCCSTTLEKLVFQPIGYSNTPEYLNTKIYLEGIQKTIANAHVPKHLVISNCLHGDDSLYLKEKPSIHPRQRVKAKWNSDFRFGGKSATASNKASHAASKSLLFSFVLDTFQAISVIFFNSTGTRRFVIFTCNAVEFTSHFKMLYTITRHSNANVDLKYFCFL